MDVREDGGVIVLDERYAEAVAYASGVHGQQARRDTATPYIAHLLGVSSLVLEAGGDQDLAIAALLHDSAEDHGGEARLADIDARFGPRVCEIVRQCSDSLTAEGEQKASWEVRKRDHLARLPQASDDTLVVWTADKVHNARAIVTDLAREGTAALNRFHAPPERLLWYYRSNLQIVSERRVTDALVVPLTLALGQFAELLAD